MEGERWEREIGGNCSLWGLCLFVTAGVENGRIIQVFSRGSRVLVGEFKTKLGQNWVEKCDIARGVYKN